MKKKGFTLIELIVVIAIIGVLAAILVPAMLGYVKRSRITTCNTTARSIYNSFNTALVDLDTADSTETYSDEKITGAKYVMTGAGTELSKTVINYFSDLEKVESWAVQLKNGSCVGCGVLNKNYTGSYPKQMSVEAWDSNKTADAALTYAQS